jgi:hypothetical protein
MAAKYREDRWHLRWDATSRLRRADGAPRKGFTLVRRLQARVALTTGWNA